MTYRVISGFQDTETGVFYDIHEEIDEKNKNLKKYLDAGVVVCDDEEAVIVDDEEAVINDGENIVDDGEKQLETTVEKTDVKDEKTNTKEDVKSKDNKKK